MKTNDCSTTVPKRLSTSSLIKATVSLQGDHLQVVRHKNRTIIDTLSLTCVEFLARVKRLFLCMIEDEMTSSKSLCVACSVKCRTVVLLIGLEALTVGIETEGLAHQPVSV